MPLNPDEAPDGFRAVPFKTCSDCDLLSSEKCSVSICRDGRKDGVSVHFKLKQTQPDLLNAAVAMCEWGKVPVDKCDHCAEFRKSQTVTISAELSDAYVNLLRVVERVIGKCGYRYKDLREAYAEVIRAGGGK